MPGIIVKPRSRILHGHDWVYQSEVLKTWGDPADGSTIVLKDGKDRLLGTAIYNSHSQIIARRYSRQRQDLDADFFRRRIGQAIQYRRALGLPNDTARLVWSESDGIPGLIIDRYGPHLVLQTLTRAMDERIPLILDALHHHLQPTTIIERNDAPIRTAEGLELRTGILHGSAPEPFWHPIGANTFLLDLLHGQKTGFYLDQVDAYPGVARHAAGRRVLDCFSNQGAFALACARAGAASVEAVEISRDTAAQLSRNAEHNQLPLTVHCANAFDFLREAQTRATHGPAYDLIILDPPSFTRTKGRLDDALRGYKDIHVRALSALAPGGMLATFCCSHHVSREEFLGTINAATVDARRTLRQLATFSQSLDHPIIPTLPETEYLKGFLFELAPGR